MLRNVKFTEKSACVDLMTDSERTADTRVKSLSQVVRDQNIMWVCVCVCVCECVCVYV